MFSSKFISRCRILTKSKQKFFIPKPQIYFYNSTLNNYDEKQDFVSRIIYNEVLQESEKNKPKKVEVEKPLCLKYLLDDNVSSEKIVEKNNETDNEDDVVHFPYKVENSYLNEVFVDNSIETFVDAVNDFTPSDTETIKVPQWHKDYYYSKLSLYEKTSRWAFINQDDESEEIYKFGTSDPDAKVSNVPCGGCGALLHCNDPTLPGFIPVEIFEGKKLNGEKCQRCHFLKEFSVPLGVNVSAAEYSKIMSQIKEKNALALIMIDALDFPCSIYPGIFDIIGSEKKVVLVVNKIDLLIKDGPRYFTHYMEAIMRSLKKQKFNLRNIKHVHLISAKTGYGVEKLIDLLMDYWSNEGDIYLIGCTNVGKSSLFNTLINSDYCKTKAQPLIQRATVSAWPGTTLNLLKFPIAHVNSWLTIARSKRLYSQEEEFDALYKWQALNQNIMLEQIPLQDYVGKTFVNSESENESKKAKGIHPANSKFLRSNWFYDTPGVVHEDQIINLLTTSELLLTVPKKMLLPRNFLMKPGTSLFIGGLARLDYFEGNDYVWFTVYASMELPITITKLEDADDVYKNCLGSSYFKVPTKGKNRLEKWPPLKSKQFNIKGGKPKSLESVDELQSFTKDPNIKEADVDVVLSSAGWVSVVVPPAQKCVIEAWTPEGRGIYLREFPIIRFGHVFKGPRIPGTPAFSIEMKEVKGFTVNDKPPF